MGGVLFDFDFLGRDLAAEDLVLEAPSEAVFSRSATRFTRDLLGSESFVVAVRTVRTNFLDPSGLV